MKGDKKRGRDYYSISEKKAQVTLFIIIALVIIAAALLFYFLVPRAETEVIFDETNPQAFIQTCIEDRIKDTAEIISLQGGSIEPENYIFYQGNKIEYLCYTTEYYVPCKIQQPFLIEHIESEIENEIANDMKGCFDALVDSYEKRGYNVNLEGSGKTNIEVLAKRIKAVPDYTLTVSGRGGTDRYEKFSIMINNNLYELASMSNDIIDWEAEYGDFDTTYYTAVYSSVKFEKQNQLDGSTIYILTNRDQGNKFQFASRSVAWPPGYGEIPVFE
jgi:hypothetical protein